MNQAAMSVAKMFDGTIFTNGDGTGAGGGGIGSASSQLCVENDRVPNAVRTSLRSNDPDGRCDVQR